MFTLLYWTGAALIGICASAAGIGLYRLWFAIGEWRKGNGLRWM